MCPGTGRGNEQQLSADAKGRKSCSNHRCPELHTGDLIDHNSVIPERKGKMRAQSALQDRYDLGNLQMCCCIAIKISLVFLLGRVYRERNIALPRDPPSKQKQELSEPPFLK